MQIRRVVIIVLDGLGVGEMPDAYMYGDAGSNTLSHVAKAVGGVNLPLLASFGLGCLTEVEGVNARPRQRPPTAKWRKVPRVKILLPAIGR